MSLCFVIQNQIRKNFTKKVIAFLSLVTLFLIFITSQNDVSQRSVLYSFENQIANHDIRSLTGKTSRLPTMYTKIPVYDKYPTAKVGIRLSQSLGEISDMVYPTNNFEEASFPPHVTYTFNPWMRHMEFDYFKLHPHGVIGKTAKTQDDTGEPWDPESLLNLLDKPSRRCRRLVSIGGKYDCTNCRHCYKDGHKYVCFDPDTSPRPRDCIVYSFGIGENYSFDSGMAAYNCTVYAFDMTLVGGTTRRPSRNLHLIMIGLGKDNLQLSLEMTNEDNTDNNTVNASVRNIRTITEILNHENLTIDILKMDIEHNEWTAFEYMLKNESDVIDRVRQMDLELHLDHLRNDTVSERVSAGRRYESVLSQLKDRGFYLANTELNVFSQKFMEVRGTSFGLFRESLLIKRPDAEL